MTEIDLDCGITPYCVRCYEPVNIENWDKHIMDNFKLFGFCKKCQDILDEG